jgi:phosphoribosylformimino-5-aminoimidazole carboxamide ribonucleotide (ProFAR) isomerase
MDYGIEIYLPQLNSISIAKDGKSVTVGGGINSKNLMDTLWAAGKQTGKLSSYIHKTFSVF